MKRFEKAMLLSLVFVFIVGIVSFEDQCKEIRESVLRMHIIANSDSREDQELKLKVRDRLLSESEAVFSGCETREEAENAARLASGRFLNAAREVIERNGSDYDVSVRIGKAWFDTRAYGNITLPAGAYEAVNVYIGKAEGHNWWCVMFPQLCLPAASGDELKQVLSDEQENIVEGDYKVGFYVVELWQKLING